MNPIYTEGGALMLFTLISILVLCLVSLYFIQENISLVKLFKNFAFRSAKSMEGNFSKQITANQNLEAVQDNVLDFNAFKEAHQKQ